MNIQAKTVFIAILTCSLAGCGTPDDVRDYAKMTDAHIVTMNEQLSGFGLWENETIRSRRETALQLYRLANGSEQTLKQKTDRVGTGDEPCKSSKANCIRVYELVLSRYAQDLQTAASAEEKEAAFTKSLDAKLVSVPEKLAPIKANLELAGKSAANLSQELSKKEQAEFLFRFGKQVKKTYDDGRKEAEDQKDKEGQAAN